MVYPATRGETAAEYFPKILKVYHVESKDLLTKFFSKSSMGKKENKKTSFFLPCGTLS